MRLDEGPQKTRVPLIQRRGDSRDITGRIIRKAHAPHSTILTILAVLITMMMMMISSLVAPSRKAVRTSVQFLSNSFVFLSSFQNFYLLSFFVSLLSCCFVPLPPHKNNKYN